MESGSWFAICAICFNTSFLVMIPSNRLQDKTRQQNKNKSGVNILWGDTLPPQSFATLSSTPSGLTAWGTHRTTLHAPGKRDCAQVPRQAASISTSGLTSCYLLWLKYSLRIWIFSFATRFTRSSSRMPPWSCRMAMPASSWQQRPDLRPCPICCRVIRVHVFSDSLGHRTLLERGERPFLCLLGI